MEHLIKVTRHNGKKVVSAQDLHEKLEVKTRFNMWFSRRVKEYGFQEDKDFCTILGKSIGGRPSTDYAITIEMAKELGMLEGNEIGQKIRRYFIEVENRSQPDFTPIIDMKDHSKREIQLLNSKEVNTFIYENNGTANAIMQYNIKNCKLHTGESPADIRKRYKNAKLPASVKKSAKEILRRTEPITACAMSLTDNMVKLGANHEEAAEMSNKHGREIFKFMLNNGIIPGELSQ